MHCGQVVQSHALSFFHLSAPDLLLGFDSDPARRNIIGVIEEHPQLASDGIALRQFGQQVIEGLAGERIHPSWTVPGGVNAPLEIDGRDRILEALPEAKAIALRTLDFFKGVVDRFSDEIEHFGNEPTMYAGLVNDRGDLQLYDGDLRFTDAAGEVVVDRMAAQDYAQYIGEATVPHSFLKAPYFKPLGYPGWRSSVSVRWRASMSSPAAARRRRMSNSTEYHQRFGKVVQSSFHFHYARLIEIIYCIERMEQLLNDPAIFGRHVRAHAGVNALEGIGMCRSAARQPRSITTRSTRTARSLGQPHHRDRQQQSGDRPQHQPGQPALCRWQQAAGRHAQSGAGGPAGIRPVSELLDPRGGPISGGDQVDRCGWIRVGFSAQLNRRALVDSAPVAEPPR